MKKIPTIQFPKRPYTIQLTCQIGRFTVSIQREAKSADSINVFAQKERHINLPQN